MAASPAITAQATMTRILHHITISLFEGSGVVEAVLMTIVLSMGCIVVES